MIDSPAGTPESVAYLRDVWEGAGKKDRDDLTVKDSVRWMSRESLREMFPDVEAEGVGRMRLVVKSPNKEGRVVAYVLERDKELTGAMPMVELYFLQKLARVLYPDFFPKMSFVSEVGMYSEREDLSELPAGEESKKQQIAQKIVDVESDLKSMRIDIDLDDYFENAKRKSDGSLIYIDTMKGGAQAVRFIRFPMVTARIEKVYGEKGGGEIQKQKRIALMAINQLKELDVVDQLLNKRDPKADISDDDVKEIRRLLKVRDIQPNKVVMEREKKRLSWAVDKAKSGLRWYEGGWH